MVEPVVEDVEKLKLLRAEKLSTSNIDESEDEDRAVSVDIYVGHYKGEFPFSGGLIISYLIKSYHIIFCKLEVSAKD